jgi:hypothetical protein
MGKFTKGNTAGKGRPPGSLNAATVEVRGLAQRLLGSRKYRKQFRERLESGTLPPALEGMLWAYAFGRPLADAPEVPAIVPGTELQVLAAQLVSLSPAQFSAALTKLLHIDHHEPAALPASEKDPVLSTELQSMVEAWSARAKSLLATAGDCPAVVTVHVAHALCAEFPETAILEAAHALGEDVFLGALTYFDGAPCNPRVEWSPEDIARRETLPGWMHDAFITRDALDSLVTQEASA